MEANEGVRFKTQLEQSTIMAEMIKLSHELNLGTVAVMIQREEEWFTIGPILWPGLYRDEAEQQKHRATLNVLKACRDFSMTMRANHNPAEPEKPWDRLRKQREEARRHMKKDEGQE